MSRKTFFIGLDGKKRYTVQGVADVLGVHYNTAYKQISRGKIKSFKVGVQYRVEESILEKVINGNSSDVTTCQGGTEKNRTAALTAC